MSACTSKLIAQFHILHLHSPFLFSCFIYTPRAQLLQYGQYAASYLYLYPTSIYIPNNLIQSLDYGHVNVFRHGIEKLVWMDTYAED